ncbi:MAG: GTPase HflX [Candidatus Dormibacterales bacterium]
MCWPTCGTPPSLHEGSPAVGTRAGFGERPRGYRRFVRETPRTRLRRGTPAAEGGPLIPTSTSSERAYLFGVQLPSVPQRAVVEQMIELAELCRTAGADVVGQDVQRREDVDPAHFIGSGKVQELKRLRVELSLDAIVCNEDLSPRQQRNLERELELKVVDRTEIILDIFARHARTHEGRLQVESAQLHHLLPRVIGAYDYHRQVGGIGARGGPGEQQIEIERRRIRRRLRDLDRELDQVRAQREQQRAARRRSELLTVAIVGYTNAGKSTLLNALTGSSILSQHRLFATLDPTTRRLRLGSGREILLTDTVGFIQKLPTDLVAAFRATLEEVTYADVVLRVIDASSPVAADHARTVDEVLGQLGAQDKPTIVALNKADLLGPAARLRVLQDLGRSQPHAVAISATTGAGLEPLLDALDRSARPDSVAVELLVPYGEESVLAALRQVGGLERTEYVPEGTRAWGWAPGHAAHRFARFKAPTRGTRPR